LTLIEVVVLIAVIAVLVMVILAVLAKRDARPSGVSCRSNLIQIGIAFRVWEGDHNDKYPMEVSTNSGGSMEFGAGNDMFWHFWVMSNEISNPLILVCPTDDRKPTKDFATLSNTNLSYFVGLDADETFPAMILAGDRNLVTNGVDVVPGLVVITPNTTAGWSGKMHKFAGNFGLADGSVQQGTSADLQTYFGRTGTNVNRLAVP
jgi:hypothetical protein